MINYLAHVTISIQVSNTLSYTHALQTFTDTVLVIYLTVGAGKGIRLGVSFVVELVVVLFLDVNNSSTNNLIDFSKLTISKHITSFFEYSFCKSLRT